MSSSHPLAPSDLVGDLRKSADVKALKDKQKRSHRGQVTFQWRKFANPGRSDGLELEHWVKCYRDVAGRLTPADPGPYAFSKYNTSVKILKYNDEEWEKLIENNEDWSKEETDYLLYLCERFDFRWLIISDRYGDFDCGFPAFAKGKKNRDVEDLKDRYYSIARQLLVGREGGQESVANHVVVKHPFNPARERERKRGIEVLMNRSTEQDKEEGRVLAEAQAIEQKRREEAKARRAAAGPSVTAAAPGLPGAGPSIPVQVSEYWGAPEVGTLPLFNERGEPTGLPETTTGNAVARAAHTREIAQSFLDNYQPAKNQKALVGAMEDLKMEVLPRGANRAVCGAYLALVQEVAELLELKRKLATKQAAIAGVKRTKREEEEEEGAGKRQRTSRRPFDD